MARLDRDMPDIIAGTISKTPVVDEQTKAAGMRAAQSDSAAAAKTIAKSSDQLMLEQAEALLTKQKTKLADLEKIQAEQTAAANVAKGLNPDGTRKTVAQRIEENRIERETTQAGLNPDNPKPSEDPGPGMYWANYGGVWRKYKYVVAQSFGNPGGSPDNNNNNNNNNNANNNGNGNPIITDTTGKPTTNIDVLKASLRGLGFTSAIIDQSTSFLNGLIRDGLDIDNATEIFLNSKEYTLKNGTKMTSPFYTEYGYLNEGLTVPKDASTLFNTVEGFKGVVDKYKLSTKYITQDSLKAYFKNDVTVADLSERAATAQLRAVEADQFQVNALVKLGYIGSAADLTDFYLDAKIGKEQLELNRQTGVFTAEALRRAKSGISTSADQLKGFKQLTATLAAKGYSEAQISQLAGTGFENISETLLPTTAFAQMFEKAGGTVESNAALTEDIQTSLLAEEFTGTASQRRKKLFEQNVRSFQGQSGTTTGSLRTSSVAGLL
jgi:hypothetical protein